MTLNEYGHKVIDQLEKMGSSTTDMNNPFALASLFKSIEDAYAAKIPVDVAVEIIKKAYNLERIH